MRFILIDCENIFPSLDLIKSGDKVFAFLGVNQSRIQTDWLIGVQERQAELTLVRSEVQGANALDFVLSAHIGEVFSSCQDGEVVICSRDKGFDSLVEHYTSRGYTISRTEQAHTCKVVVSVDELRQLVETRLSSMAGKPKNIKGLLNTMRSVLRGIDARESTIKRVLNELRNSGSISDNGSAIIYHLKECN